MNRRGVRSAARVLFPGASRSPRCTLKLKRVCKFPGNLLGIATRIELVTEERRNGCFVRFRLAVDRLTAGPDAWLEPFRRAWAEKLVELKR